MPEITREEFNGVRLYNGKFPSVTTVTDFATEKFILEWQKSVGIEQATYARDMGGAFGTAIHGLAEKIAASHATGDPVVVDNPAHVPFAQAVRKFMNLWIDEVLLVEKSFVSATHGFGGTLDLLATLSQAKGGGLAVVDFKTSKRLKPEYDLQVGGYSLLAKDHGYDVDRRLIVRIKKEAGAHGKYYAREPKTELRVDENGFLGLLEFYRWAKRNTMPDFT